MTDQEDPNTFAILKMLKTKRCKGINGRPCSGRIRIDKTGVEGLACWLAVCHYGHTFSFFLPVSAVSIPETTLEQAFESTL